jgi:hypothetical protein
MTIPALVQALWLPLLFVAGALWLAHRERASYRSHRDDNDAGFFVYTPRRLRRRLTGAAVLAAVGVTLALWDLARPETAERATLIVVALLVEVLLLVGIAVADFIETARRSAAPPTVPRAPADPDRRTRTPPRRPR